MSNGICAGIFGRGRSRVAGSFERRGGRDGESRVKSFERVETANPGEGGGHFIASIPWGSHRSGGVGEVKLGGADGQIMQGGSGW